MHLLQNSVLSCSSDQRKRRQGAKAFSMLRFSGSREGFEQCIVLYLQTVAAEAKTARKGEKEEAVCLTVTHSEAFSFQSKRVMKW